MNSEKNLPLWWLSDVLYQVSSITLQVLLLRWNNEQKSDASCKEYENTETLVMILINHNTYWFL